MATVKFRVLHKSDNAQIYLRLSLSRDNVFQSKTGKTINPAFWSSKTSRPIQKLPEFKNLALELNELETFIMKSYNSDYAKGVIFSKEWLDEKINSFYNRIDEKIDDSVFIIYLSNFIDFKKSIIVGNKLSDMQFGRNAGMFTAFVATTNPDTPYPHELIDVRFNNLLHFAQALTKA